MSVPSEGPLRVLDLFSGIGGFSLGLEHAGMQTVAFCEIEPFCRKVLAKHWPDVPCYNNVKELTHDRLAADGLLPIDLICGGFPCQDISVAGKGAGIEGERSGLWKEVHRLICEVRPQYAFVENVAALRSRGLHVVLADLAAVGYDAEWHCIPACAVGAPHERDRVWIVAYAQNAECKWVRAESGGSSDGFANSGKVMADADQQSLFGAAITRQERAAWLPEPDVGRVAHGIPARVDRLRALGNAVVPQVVELIGRAIMEVERAGSE